MQQKKDRHHGEKEEWARIFQELMREVEKLKREIAELQKSNEKLVHLYSEPLE